MSTSPGEYRRPVTETAAERPSTPPLRGVGTDVAWTYVSVLSVGVTSLLVPALALRSVGASGYGLYALVAAAASLVIPIDVGLSLGVSRAAARQATMASGAAREAERQHVVAAQSIYAGAALAAMAATLVGAAAVLLGGWGAAGQSPAGVAVLVALLGANVAVVLATSASNGMVVGLRRFRTVGGAAVVGAAVTCGVLPWAMEAFSIPGVGLAVLVGTVVSRGLLVDRARRFAPWMTFRMPRRHDDRVREVAKVAGPLIAIGIGGQIVAATDVFVISLLGSSASVGLYRAASLVPSQIINLIFRGYDASFPALAQEQDPRRQEDATRVLTKLASVAAGVALGGAAWLSADLVRVVAGQDSHLGSAVLRIFAAVWCVNAAAHGLALMLIARVQQRVFAPLVIGESVMNLAASLVLVWLMGPIGAAWATLVTITASNLIVLPIVTRKHLAGSTFSLVLVHGFLFAVLGAVVAGGVVLLTSLVGLHGGARLGVAAAGLLFSGLGLAGVAIGRDGRDLVAGAFRRPPKPAPSLVPTEVAA